ncbi:MAG TPA: hypothetical protein VF163_12175, partial [Micromonosporaceae bacterium]
MATVSRRSFLAVAGLAPAALLRACDITPPPASSPFLVGPYATAQVILGESANTAAMDQVISASPQPADYPYCQDGKNTTLPLPSKIKAAVYYPQRLKDPYVTGPNPLSVMKGPHPVLLFAHGVRVQYCATPYPIDRDFTRAEVILRHVAAYGCVAV